MNKTAIDRRRFLGVGASAALLPMLGTRSVLAQDKTTIRHFWWGNPERDKRTFGVIEVFNAKHPDIEVVGETVGFGDYFPKLTTQMAGGNMPDVIQHGYGAIFEYIERGALLPLDEYVGGTLDISRMDDSAIKAGTFLDKLYAISIGANAHMALYNTAMFEAAGIDFDPYGWTYDDVKRISTEVTKATPEGVFGTDDNTANWQNFSDFVVQSGGQLFTPDDQMGCTPEMLVEYWTIWKDIREAGGAPPAKASAGLVNANMAEWGLVTGQTAVSYQWSNQLVGAQALVQDKLGAAMYPNKPEMNPGSYVQPSQFICLTRDTVDAEAATAYMSAFVNDPDMTNILGLERGIPANSDARAALVPNLSDAEAVSVAYFDGIRGKTAPLPPPFPSGTNEVEETYERIATGILLDQDTMEEAAKNFIRQANFVLQRA
jgi:multiple sugar transport system substrate-binding protein